MMASYRATIAASLFLLFFVAISIARLPMLPPRSSYRRNPFTEGHRDCDDLDKSIIEGYLKLTASERQTIKKYIKSLYNAEIASMPAAAPRRETIEELEAAYEKSLGIVPKTRSSASSTTGGARKEA